jgi:hypothetical protein
LKSGSFTVQGLIIKVLCQSHLYSLVSSYLTNLCEGEHRPKTKPLELEISVVETPRTIPPDSIQAIKRPSITSYLKGNDIYFTSTDGSLIYLDPINRKSKTYLTKDILKDTMMFFSLLGGSIVETLKYNGLHFLHAAALQSNGVRLLISGDGGCGKTTTSLSLVRAGFKYVSDDSLFFEEQHGEIRVSPFYSTFHIDRDLSERFPELTNGHERPIPKGIKIAIDPSQTYPGSFIPLLRPNVIIFPKITSKQKSTLRPIGQIEVCNRLLTQIILAADKEVSTNQLESLQKLVSQTVGFELLSGRDVYEDPYKLIDLIGSVTGKK